MERTSSSNIMHDELVKRMKPSACRFKCNVDASFFQFPQQNSIYGGSDGVSEFRAMPMIKCRRHLLVTDLANSKVKFI